MLEPANHNPIVVCLTPVKNERANLPRFLACAAMWADHVIVLDQCSTDGSREIAAAHPMVRLIVNDDPSYDEVSRQRRLLAAAREIPGPRVVVALDADEALSANAVGSRSWHEAISSPPGTVLRMRWADLLPDGRAWISQDVIPFGFVDDGREHGGGPIHNRRVPAGPSQPSLVLEDVRVLHYQFTAWHRMKSKQRWYQAWERVHHPQKTPIQLYRQYHHMDAIPSRDLQSAPSEWSAAYVSAGIDMGPLPEQRWYFWDEQVLALLVEHGVEPFSRLDIWGPDYEALAHSLGWSINPSHRLRDPRGSVTRLVHRGLARTQAHAGRGSVRTIQRAMRLFGW